MLDSKVMEMNTVFAQDDVAKQVAWQWDKYNQQRRVKIEDWKELRNYIFATDTSSTSNSSLPWKNSTHLPKLCQVRDNLHSNYISALFPNDDWMTWEADDMESAAHEKAEAIEGYLKNKARKSHLRTEVSKLLYDYIDYGNAFATVSYCNDYKVNEDGESIPQYIGPRLHRISPLDIVFNPMADNFSNTFKIIRSIKTVGEIQKLAATDEDWRNILEQRNAKLMKLGGFSIEDFDKWDGYSVDGFGNLYEYYTSGFVEILEFYGDISVEGGEVREDRIITVVDRSLVVKDVECPSWFGTAPIFHVGWRFRPDNLWAMGPLDNLVGLQYRIDHLENLKSDAMDLAIHPPLVIKGDVEEFEWGPGAEIIANDGDVQELAKNVQWVITSQNEIAQIEQKMETYAGAPAEAMGIRTAGEKTAFEVQQLQNAAGRIFQEKITTFEIELLEPALMAMLEVSRRNLDGSDIIRVMDDDLGIQKFLTVTRSDITASGTIRPIGARHFAAQAQLVQNLAQTFNTPIGQMIMPHTSSINMAKMLGNVFGVEQYNLFEANIALQEQQETQRMQNQLQEDLMVEMQQPPAPVGAPSENIPS